MKRAGRLLLAALAGWSGPAVGVEPVPFVGCASDGQLGPEPAPVRGDVPAPASDHAAGRLACYASGRLGVLAPRGWHCLALYGSNGSFLIVTPEPHDAAELRERPAQLPGPAVELSYNYGGTSGRFTVAAAIARLFPDYADFVGRVRAEGIVSDFPTGPDPGDNIDRLSPTEVAFVRPDGRRGVVILLPDERNEEPDLLRLDVRLPPEQAPLADTIVAAVRQDRGSASIIEE